MSVIGIDPSLTGTGIAMCDGWETIHTDSSQPDGERLGLIHEAVLAAVGGRTRLAVVEDLPTHAKGAGLTGMAHGVVRLALHVSGVPMLTVPPATLKKYATGNGNANKADMRMALYQRVGLDLRDDNQVDAYWLMCAGEQLLGSPRVILPAAQVKALDKIALPMEVA